MAYMKILIITNDLSGKSKPHRQAEEAQSQVAACHLERENKIH